MYMSKFSTQHQVDRLKNIRLSNWNAVFLKQNALVLISLIYLYQSSIV